MSPKNAKLVWLDETDSTAYGQALGTDVTLVVTNRAMLHNAKRQVREVVNAIDQTCSRFRSDSEVSRLNARGGATVKISGLLVTAVSEALRMAEITDGDVDPTLGAAIRALGYDRDFKLLHRAAGHEAKDSRVTNPGNPSANWRSIDFRPEKGTVVIPRGVELDLGATAKALGADLAAEKVIQSWPDGGVLVSLGGDVAMAGQCPAGGWVVGVDMESSTPSNSVTERVAVSGGGVASSSTQIRTWERNGARMHHILDPRTGLPAGSPFKLVTVIARSCVDANAASTAAVVRGEAILYWLRERQLPARLERRDGSVVRVAGWPEERTAA